MARLSKEAFGKDVSHSMVIMVCNNLVYFDILISSFDFADRLTARLFPLVDTEIIW
jgi:hypothetical protein